jgi:hypothetical protein
MKPLLKEEPPGTTTTPPAQAQSRTGDQTGRSVAAGRQSSPSGTSRLCEPLMEGGSGGGKEREREPEREKNPPEHEKNQTPVFFTFPITFPLTFPFPFGFRKAFSRLAAQNRRFSQGPNRSAAPDGRQTTSDGR